MPRVQVPQKILQMVPSTLHRRHLPKMRRRMLELRARPVADMKALPAIMGFQSVPRARPLRMIQW